jgi:YYY domain-containing protein
MIQIAYAAIWWLSLLVIGVITFPLVSRVCNRLPDKGYSLSKILGLLLITYFSWLLASAHLIKFGYINIILSVLILLALSLFLGRKRLNPRLMPLKAMAISEALFSAAFVLFLLFLMYKPDIFYAYSEDFMDFAFLQSILRTDYFPPLDPWLAGETLPYYYGGHLLVAIMTLITKVPSYISYNLAMAMFFALAVCAAYGLGYNATKRKLYGFVTVVFVCIAGFITGAFQLSSYISGHEILGYGPKQGISFVEWLLNFDLGVGVIPHTCTSYPYFVFSQGDLHPHTMSIPFQLMFIALVFSLFKRGRPAGGDSKWDSLLIIFILGISLGFFSLLNMWEYPTYIAFTLLAFILLGIGLSKKGILGAVGLSALLYLPYFISRGGVSGVHGVGLVDIRTELIDFVEIFALFLLPLVSYFCILSGHRSLRERTLVIALSLTVVAALLSFLWGFQLVLVLIPLILASLYYIYRERRARHKNADAFMMLIVLMGALILLFCEIFYVNDSLSAPNERYNTIMKFYLQVWVFLGVASAYAVFWVLENVWGKLRTLWIALLIVLVIASIIHPIGSTTGWTSGRHTAFGVNRGTLDGLAYVETIDKGDYEAILWIDAAIEGTPVILEAPGGAYNFTSRISTMTGLPTVMGWLTHEVMWRGSWDSVAGRDTDTDTIYNTTDGEEAVTLLEKYNVEYIYIGTIEREKYESEGLQKFAGQPDRYELVYDNLGVSIYRVIAQ